jgi:hypothetical protein
MPGNNLPTIRRFKVEDYTGSPEWFATFLEGLNLFVDPVYQMVSGGLNYSNMVAPKIYTTNLTSPAAGNVTLSFTNPLKIQPSAVVMGNVYVSGNTASHPAAAIQPFWHYSGNTIYIDNIVGLATSTKYVLTFVIF